MIFIRGFLGGASSKELACQSRRHKRHRFNSWVGEIPWRRAWQPTPVFLPGESQGRGSLVGCRLWGHTVGRDWSDLEAAAAALQYSPLYIVIRLKIGKNSRFRFESLEIFLYDFLFLLFINWFYLSNNMHSIYMFWKSPILCCAF